MKTEILGIKKVNISDDAIITVRYTPGWILRLFGMSQHVIQYRGSGTVWRDYATCERTPQHLDRWLCKVWKKWKWETRE